jgi:hypothetical protein
VSDLWNDARELDALTYSLVWGELARSANRALIADLANGVPPYTKEEVEKNGIVVNVNGLDMTRALHNGRGQFYNGFLKPGKYFTCRTDYGPRSKRDLYGTIVTSEINKILKKSVPYFESMRAKFALLMLHGISPTVWTSEDRWCPRPLGVDDVLMPSGTELGFENLPFFVLRRQFTGIELQKLTQTATRDPGWNMDLVDRCLEWVDEQTFQLMGNQFPEIWAPEKVAEDIKEMSRFTAVDQSPKICCFDIYAWNDQAGEEGWIRRIILDAWSTPSNTGLPAGNRPPLERRTDYVKSTDGSTKPGANDFLYNSGSRKVGQSWQQIIGFQFADLTAVAPFRYHNVRSLGFLLYGACHLQNRMRCKFNEAVFEALMMYFKVKTEDDVQRALKLQLINKGFIDETMMPLQANERYQVPTQLVELGLQQNAALISESAGAFAQRRDFSKDRTEKTRYQVMAELNADTALVGAAVEQAFQYQGFEDEEILRRFMKDNSSDPECRAFQAACLRQEVPEDLLDATRWDVEHERVMGAGNKTVEMQIADWLMAQREKFDPDSQRKILKHSTLMFTGDARFTEDLVKDQPEKMTTSVRDAEFASARLMQGLPTEPNPHSNQQEVISRMLVDLAGLIKQFMQKGGMAPPDKLQGMNAIVQYIAASIKLLAVNPESKQQVAAFGKALGKMQNELRAFGQRLQAAIQKRQKAAQGGNGSGGPDPQTKAKVAGQLLIAKTKAETARVSHAQKTAQRQIQFQQDMKQDQERHKLEMAKRGAEFVAGQMENRMRSIQE